MKLDSAVKSFLEKYDQNAIQSIEDISQESGLVRHKRTVPGFNLLESVEAYIDFINGWGKYKVENVGKTEGVQDDSVTTNNLRAVVADKIFKQENVLYAELPQFVTGYLESIKRIGEAVDQVKASMMEGGVTPESVGLINEFTDIFIERLDESFEPFMEYVLRASGYRSKQRLSRPRSGSPRLKPVFL